MPNTLQALLADAALRSDFVTRGVALIDAEVARKSGLRGMAVKAGYKTLKALRPGMVAEALNGLLPAFAPAVEPHFAAAQSEGDVAGYFARNATQIAEAMLEVTDRKAERADNRLIQRTYRSLRGQAHHHTAEAMPAVGELMARYA